METKNMSLLQVNGMTCKSCEARVHAAILEVPGITSAVVSHSDNSVYFTPKTGSLDEVTSAIISAGYSVGDSDISFDWMDREVWGKSAYNTMWCLIGCSIGDLGTIGAFQFIFTDSGWSTMQIMLLAMFNGIMTSIILETIILSKQMILSEAFKVAIGMSLISMIGMEAAMNLVDYFLTGGAMLTWWVIPIMLAAGFVTPWPYNYWRLKKYGKACH